ncbi:hypothetical protein M514_27818 [Trichuris suis]|uniref:Uncharacterized protein n=1 Tax=Trichuris suis TaxID=68888 RepID=A0A085MS01_9BILA|nr:hypothetical protein M514_27818 [Trichuris suis]
MIQRAVQDILQRLGKPRLCFMPVAFEAFTDELMEKLSLVAYMSAEQQSRLLSLSRRFIFAASRTKHFARDSWISDRVLQPASGTWDKIPYLLRGIVDAVGVARDSFLPHAHSSKRSSVESKSIPQLDVHDVQREVLMDNRLFQVSHTFRAAKDGEKIIAVDSRVSVRRHWSRVLSTCSKKHGGARRWLPQILK